MNPEKEIGGLPDSNTRRKGTCEYTLSQLLP